MTARKRTLLLVLTVLPLLSLNSGGQVHDPRAAIVEEIEMLREETDSLKYINIVYSRQIEYKDSVDAIEQQPNEKSNHQHSEESN